MGGLGLPPASSTWSLVESLHGGIHLTVRNTTLFETDEETSLRHN